jgi:hypothetical protein
MTGCFSIITGRSARVSGWDAVAKSRLRLNPFALARVPATRPSGFCVTLKYNR